MRKVLKGRDRTYLPGDVLAVRDGAQTVALVVADATYADSPLYTGELQFYDPSGLTKYCERDVVAVITVARGAR